MKFNLIVAYDLNNGIGKNNKLPWNIPDDLKHFSNLTRGNGNNAVIMGKNTWLSLTKELKNRDNLILSKSLEINNNQKIFKNLNDLLIFIKNKNYDDVWVIGGEKIYKLFLDNNLINTIYATTIKYNFNCDTFFPLINYKYWITTIYNKFNYKNLEIKYLKLSIRNDYYI